jgi:hypothetical protein
MGMVVDLAVVDYCRQAGRQAGSGQVGREADKQTGRQATGRQATGRQIDRQAGGQTYRQTDRQVDTQADR